MENFLKKITSAPGKVINKIGDFFAPVPDKVRARDVAREIIPETLNIGKEILKGGARFAKSAGEGVAGAPLELNELINPGTRLKVQMYEPEKIPGLGFLGPIESYQNQFKRETAEGKSKGVGLLKATGNVALDEPIGVALKPFGLAFGAMMKSGAGKAIEQTFEKLVKAVKPEEVKALLMDLNVGKKAIDDLAEPLTKAKTLDEVKDILGYGKKIEPKNEDFVYHTTSMKNIKPISEKGLTPSKKGQYGPGTYFAPTEDLTGGYGSSEGAMLRVRRDKLPEDFQEWPGEQGWTTKGIPPEAIEFKIKGEQEWKPIKEKVSSKTETMYHGTSAPEFSEFNKDGLVYLTRSSDEAKAYSENPIIGGGRGKGESRILEVDVPEGKTRDINNQIQEAMMEGDDIDELIAKAARDAKNDGYDFLSFMHPSTVNDGEFEAIVAVNPSKLGIKKVGAKGQEIEVDAYRSYFGDNKSGIFYSQEPLKEYGDKSISKTIKFKNAYKTDGQIQALEDLFGKAEADKFMKSAEDMNIDLTNPNVREQMTDPNFMKWTSELDKKILDELKKRGYDGAIIGDNQIADLRKYDPAKFKGYTAKTKDEVGFKPSKDWEKTPASMSDSGGTEWDLGNFKIGKEDGKYMVGDNETEEILQEFDSLYEAQKYAEGLIKSEDLGGAKTIGEIIQNNKDLPPLPPEKKIDFSNKKEPERKFITRLKESEPSMGELLQGKYQRKSNEVLKETADKMIRENYEGAMNMAKTGVDDQAVAVASRMIEDELNIAKKATDEATKNKAYALAAEIANDAAKNLTEAGRAVQAASLLGKMTPEGMARFAARKIQKYNEEAGKRTLKNFLGGAKKIPELTPDQIKEIADGMEDINKMPEGIEKARKLQKLGEKIQSYIPSTLYQKIVNVWKAGLLTGLKTTGVNVASNLSHTISEVAKDVPGALVDKIVSLFTGERKLVFTTKGAGEGSLEGVKKGWDYLKTGFDERNIADKLDYKKVNFGKGKVADGLKKYTDTVFGLLGAEDQPFYYAAKLRSMTNQAMAMAKNEGLKGKQAKDFVQKMLENPTEDMMKYSTLDAETAVFQQDSWLARKAQNLQKGLEIVLPFAKTPANVANAMINYSPAGIAKTIIENIGKGRFDQRLFSQGMGRGITGTAALAIGSALMANKLMNLGMPTSEKERKQWELEGRIPNSIKINGRWRNIGVLGPAGMVLIIGGHMREGMDETGSFAGGLAQAAGGFGSALTEQSFLSGVNKAIDAIKDPSRSFDGFASSLAGSIVPTLIADIARGTDQYERKTTGIKQRLQSRIPGARQGLQPQVDTLGNLKETPSFIEVMADPTRPGNPSTKNDQVVSELRRLMDAEQGVTPTQLGPTSGYETLTPEQNRKLLETSGKIARAEMEKLMRSKAYSRYDDEEKAKTIDSRVADVKVEARARIIIEALRGLSPADQTRKLAEMKKEGLLTKQVYSMYNSLKRKIK